MAELSLNEATRQAVNKFGHSAKKYFELIRSKIENCTEVARHFGFDTTTQNKTATENLIVRSWEQPKKDAQQKLISKSDIHSNDSSLKLSLQP